MTRRRWIADEVSGHRAALIGGHADHLVRVLRAKVGQEFDIVAGQRIYRGRVAAIADQRVEFELGEELPALSSAQLTILLSIIKFDRMEWAIEKCTELGVSGIVPVVASRTAVHLAPAAEKRVERWKRIAREAAEQSRRTSPPSIANPIKLKEAVSLEAEMRIVLSESSEGRPLLEVAQGHSGTAGMILAIGPEGGWTQAEEKLFRDAGWIPASLGETILRAETAAIAATAIILAEVL
ncbi:MAG TPA: 16S rRNA (uracil(1498)-N(3))-methyltransferase [Terriglobales bacterium]